MSDLAPIREDQITSSIYDIDLDNFDALQQEAPKELAPQLQNLGGGIEYDSTWKAHRVVKSLTKSPNIHWEFLSTKKEREEGNAPPPEINEFEDTNRFVAVRGIVVSSSFGFGLITGSQADGWNTVCKTTKLVTTRRDGSTLTTKGDRPLPFPVTQIHQSKANPHSITKVLSEGFELYGSRGPVGSNPEDPVLEPRKCSDCIAAGEHYIGTQADFTEGKQMPKCSLGGEMLFCVFQLGILDTSEIKTDVLKGRIKVKWISIEEANMRTLDSDGNATILNRPFIIKIDGLGKLQQASIGKDKFQRNLILPHESNHCFLPTTKINGKYALYSAGEYHSFLNDNRFYGKRNVMIGDTVVHPVVTELYVGKLHAPEYNQSHMPVFSPVTDESTIDAGAGWTSNDWLKTALKVLTIEKQVAEGKAKIESIPSPRLTAITQQQDAVETIAPAKDKPVTTVDKAAFTAFTAPL